MPHTDWNKSVSIFRCEMKRNHPAPLKFSVMLGELYPSISYGIVSLFHIYLAPALTPLSLSLIHSFIQFHSLLLCLCAFCILISFRKQVVIATSNDVAVCKSMRFIVCNSNVKFSHRSIVFFNIYVFWCVFSVQQCELYLASVALALTQHILLYALSARV